ncbi:MAG: TPR repeat protein [Verrucomicrobiales bacterium]|jgi:TPR repeat protein
MKHFTTINNRMRLAMLEAMAVFVVPMAARAGLEDGIIAYNNRDYAKAKEEFQTAAEAKNPMGLHLLASLYFEGHGVKKNVKHAVKLFTEAADQGLRPALTNLGIIYQSGNDGVKRDIRKAMEYFMAAGKQGDLQATYHLGQIFRKGDGVEQDYKKAIDYYRLAVQEGYLPAVHEYGIMIANGHGVAKNLVEAYAWLAYVAATDDNEAKSNLLKVKDALNDEELKHAKKRAAEISKEITRIRKEVVEAEAREIRKLKR